MEMVEILLQLIRATRCGLWHLHFASLERLCHFFVSQNRLKYAQHIPEYIAKMYNLKKTDPEVWQFFCKGNFSVRKSGQEFSNIGVDRALEQGNRTMEVMGGIKGITQMPNRRLGAKGSYLPL